LAILAGTTTAGGGAAAANWFSIRLSVFVFPSARQRALSVESLSSATSSLVFESLSSSCRIVTRAGRAVVVFYGFVSSILF